MGDTEYYTTLACAHLGITMTQVINPRIEGGEFVLIYNLGGKGCPKVWIPLTVLDAEATVPEVKVDATDGALRLMNQHRIDAADVLYFLGEDKRITARDIRRYIKEEAA